MRFLPHLLIWTTLGSGGKPVSGNLATLVKVKKPALMDPALRAECHGSGTQWSVTIHAKHPALWARIEFPGTEARYSDNFIHITPAHPEPITEIHEPDTTNERFLKSLTIKSLFDTYRLIAPFKCCPNG